MFHLLVTGKIRVPSGEMWGFRFFHEMFPPHFLDAKIIHGKFPGYKNFYAKKITKKNFTNGKRQRQLLFRNHPSLKGTAGSVEIKRETLFGPQSCLLQD